MLSKAFEVVIIGAGPVGASLACALAKSPYVQNILLLEKQKPSLTFNNIPDQRVYSINPASLRFFQSLGIASKMHLERQGFMNTIKVWNQQSLVEFKEGDNQSMSRVIQNNNILKGLYDNISGEASSKITFKSEDEIESFKQGSQGVEIKLKSGSEVTGRLLVGSDGNRSKVKELSKIKTHGWSYNQMAIVCTLELDRNIRTAFQRYYDNNVLAVLPLWDNFASIVWSAEIPLFEHLTKMNDNDFKRELMNALYTRNSPGDQPFVKSILNKRLAFPLMSLQAERYTGRRVALIGDAAHSIHPMAGLGVNSGFADSVMLANNIILNKKSGHDIGDEMSLKDYEVEAKKLNYSNSVAMEGIKKGFEIQNPVIGAARKVVLGLLNSSPVVKNELMSLAKANIFVPSRFQWEAV